MKSKDHGVIVVLWTNSIYVPSFWLMRYVGGPPEVFQRWAFPGGGIEEGETPLVAAQRELREETDIDLPAACFEPFGPSSIHERLDGTHFKMDYFIVELVEKVPKQTEPLKHGPWERFLLYELPRPMAPSGEIAVGRFLTWDRT